MTISEAHYQFKLNKDRIDTLSNQDFNAAEIDWLLNEAILIFIKQRYGVNNNKRTGFETSQKRIDDLSTLVIKYPIQPPILTNLLDTGVHEADLANCVYPYLFLIGGYVNLNFSADCSVNGVPIKFMQHDDYRVALRDPFNSPSTEFIPYNLGRSSNGNSTSIYLYSGDIIPSAISSVYVEYIKYPRKVSLGTYKYLDGLIKPVQDIELPAHTHPEIIDIACQVAALDIENPEYIQLKNQKVLMNE